MICLPLVSNTAFAITGSFKPDTTPYVGVIVLFADAEKTQPIGYCTGFLLSPTVMVTAGHSLVGVGAISACFDSGPIHFVVEEGKIVYNGTETVYEGTPVAYPHYYPTQAGNREFATSDIGLIILSQPVEGITVFPALPSRGFADSLAVKTDLRIIGYGLQYQVTPKNNGIENSWVGTVSRNTAQAHLLNTNFQGGDKYLKVTANAAQDKGGVAFGDSGGPVIHHADSQDTVVGVNAFVSNVNCGGVSYHTRLDNPLVLDWINGYIS